MQRFNVTITTPGFRHRFSAIASCAADLVDAAQDMFGICAVTVIAA